jgi:TRAP transporter TAXI family solute receptor
MNHARPVAGARLPARAAGIASMVSIGCVVLCVAMTGCGGGKGGGREFISVGTAPIGGAFYTVGSAICEVVNDRRGDLDWRVSAESTGGSMENIRLLSQGKIQFALSNSSITYFAVRGESGWEQQHASRGVMTLFPNVAMFVVPAGSPIRSVADLKGRRVYLGPEGAGFEFFVEPILRAHGLAIADLDARYGSQQSAVDLLGDGAVDAAMIGGGVPNPALSQIAQANPVRLVPYDEEAKARLIADYPFFEAARIPGGTYAGIDEPFEGLNVGSAHLITDAAVDEQVVYDFTRLVWENRARIAERHRAAAAINETNAVRANGTEFHPGAVRFYREAGLWPAE